LKKIQDLELPLEFSEPDRFFYHLEEVLVGLGGITPFPTSYPTA
jgi:hypothetical protein